MAGFSILLLAGRDEDCQFCVSRLSCGAYQRSRHDHRCSSPSDTYRHGLGRQARSHDRDVADMVEEYRMYLVYRTFNLFSCRVGILPARAIDVGANHSSSFHQFRFCSATVVSAAWPIDPSVSRVHIAKPAERKAKLHAFSRLVAIQRPRLMSSRMVAQSPG